MTFDGTSSSRWLQTIGNFEDSIWIFQKIGNILHEASNSLGWWGPRRLPYSTDSYFHILIFVFVSWVGGGDPPWVPAKSLSLHGGQKSRPGLIFFFKIGVICVWRGCKCKKKWQKKVKNRPKKGIFWLFSRLPLVKIWGLPIVKIWLF